VVKRVKWHKLREKNAEELDKELSNLKKELAKERASLAAGTRPEKPGRIRHLRRTIARILTIKREKELEEIKRAVVKDRKKEEKKKEGKKRKMTLEKKGVVEKNLLKKDKKKDVKTKKSGGVKKK